LVLITVLSIFLRLFRKVRKGNRREEVTNSFSEAMPDIVRYALVITNTAIILVHTGDRNQRFLNTVNDLVNLNFLSWSGQQVTTARAAYAFDNLTTT
jgi:hypothetical protein